MNKFILLLALISFSAITAQTEKGTFVISGQTGIGFTATTVKQESSGQTSDGPKISSFNITPSVGYFIINNLAISLDIDYKTTTTKQQITYFSFYGGNNISGGSYKTTESKTTQNSLAIIPNVTYYFSKGNVRPYLSTGLGIAKINQKSQTDEQLELSASEFYNSNDSNNGFVWGVSGGLAYFVSKNVGFDLGLGYAKYTYKENDVKTKSGALGINIGVSVFL